MPNKFKYNKTGSEANSIFKGNWAIDTTPSNTGGGPSSSTGFYNGANVPAGGYTIYGPNGAFAAANDTQLLGKVSQLGGVTTSISAALEWLTTQSTQVVLNRDFDNIVTNGLTLNLDATAISSFPNTGTTFYDLSGNANNASSRNTTEFTTFGGRRTFRLYNNGKYVYSSATDGWNAIANPGISASIVSFTFETWFYMTTDNAGQTVIISNAGGGNGYRWGPQATSAYWLLGGANDYAEGGVGSFPSLIGRWVQMIGVFDRANTYGNGPRIYCYINGSNVGSNTIPTANNMNISGPMMPGNCCGAFDGYVSIIRAYNKALTPDEVTQNWNAQKSYFGL